MRFKMSANISGVAALFLIFCSLLPSPAEAKKFYAVVAGVSEYEGILKSEPKLNLDQAAKKFANVLKGIAEDLAFGADEIEIELFIDEGDGTSQYKRPTSENLHDAIQTMSERALEGDVLALYFTGHGTAEHLNASGSDSNLFSKRVSIQWIRDLVSKSQASMKMIFLDTCQASNSNLALGDTDTLSLNTILKRKVTNGEAWFFSSSHGEKSMVDQGLRFGIFTKHLLDAFDNQAADGWTSSGFNPTLRDGKISGDELGAYLHRKVKEDVYGQYKKNQTPKSALESGFSFSLTRPSPSTLSGNTDLDNSIRLLKHLSKVDSSTRKLSFYFTHTKQSIDVTYFENGVYNPDAMIKLKAFLLDWRRKEEKAVPHRLLDIIWLIKYHSGAKSPVQVISAYRSPRTVNMLRRRKVRVARRSQHSRGFAIDFFFKDIPTNEIRNIALALGVGGVGYYRGSFIHIDIGKVRYWPRITKNKYDNLIAQTKIKYGIN